MSATQTPLHTPWLLKNDASPGLNFDFSSLAELYRFRDNRDIIRGWKIASQDDIEYSPLEDRISLAGDHIRQALLPRLREAQYDRLLNGDISRLPINPFHGLRAEAALVASFHLNRTLDGDWDYMEGTYNNDFGPHTSLTNETCGAEDHSWIMFQDAYILDERPGKTPEQQGDIEAPEI